MLQFAKIASMPASGIVLVASGGTLAVNAGGTGEFTNATSGNGSIGALFAGTGGQGNTVSLNSGSAIGIDTTNASGSLVYTGNLATAGVGLTKLGSGTLILSGANSYTGNTTISNGALQIGNAGAAGSLYSASLSGTGQLTFGSSGEIVDNTALVYSISGGALNVNQTISGSGTLNATGNQGINFANGTSINTTGSQTYSATATTGRYYGFNLSDTQPSP